MADLTLDELLRAAGSSLGDAQGQLLGGVDAAATTMAIAEATLEMKLTIDSVKGGTLQIAPVSGADARTGAVNVGALSSVTMRFVAFAGDVPGQIDAPGRKPAPIEDKPVKDGTSPEREVRPPLTRGGAEDAIKRRPDIARRIDAGETIRFDTERVAGSGGKDRWIVSARGADGGTIAAATFTAKD